MSQSFERGSSFARFASFGGRRIFGLTRRPAFAGLGFVSNSTTWGEQWYLAPAFAPLFRGKGGATDGQAN